MAPLIAGRECWPGIQPRHPSDGESYRAANLRPLQSLTEQEPASAGLSDTEVSAAS